MKHNSRLFGEQSLVNADKNKLWELINKDDAEGISKWIENNKISQNPLDLNKDLFVDEDVLDRIPVFVCIKKKKMRAFVCLIEEGKINLLAENGFNRTILNCLCYEKWLAGLDYLIKNHAQITSKSQRVHGHSGFSILHHIIRDLEKNPDNKSVNLSIIDKVLSLEVSQQLLDYRIRNKTCLDNIADNEIKKSVIKLIRKHQLRIPGQDSADNKVISSKLSDIQGWISSTFFGHNTNDHNPSYSVETQKSDMQHQATDLTLRKNSMHTMFDQNPARTPALRQRHVEGKIGNEETQFLFS